MKFTMNLLFFRIQYSRDKLEVKDKNEVSYKGQASSIVLVDKALLRKNRRVDDST